VSEPEEAITTPLPPKAKPAPPKPPSIPPPPPKPKGRSPGWVLGLVGLVVVAAIIGGLVFTGVITFGSTPHPVFTCQGPVSEWVEIDSARLTQQVRLDGQISSNQEWSDATCLDITLTEPDSGSVSIPTRWWIKNDAEWLYLLVRVPAEELIKPSVSRYGAAINYFWPEWSGESWPHSDAGSVNQDNKARDQYGWDEERWYEDTQASPPGENNVQGSMSEDGTYVWFEFRKALDSGDDRDLDWSWLPGETIGDDESALLLGVWGTTDTTWFEIYTALRLAE
jgi:hypothetical protein